MKVVFSGNFPSSIVNAYAATSRTVRKSFIRTENFIERAASKYSFMNMNGFAFQTIQFDKSGFNAVMIFKKGNEYYTVTITEE